MAEGSAEPAVEPAPISFTDTNAETGNTGQGNHKQGASAMFDLIGNLKKKQNKDGDKSKGSDASGKKKKRKKKKKGKTKKMRGTDRYESQNYLFRIEGSICCATLMMLAILIGFNMIVFLIVYCIARDNISHMFT